MNKILKISTILSGMIVSLSSPLLVYADTSSNVEKLKNNAHKKQNAAYEEAISKNLTPIQDSAVGQEVLSNGAITHDVSGDNIDIDEAQAKAQIYIEENQIDPKEAKTEISDKVKADQEKVKDVVYKYYENEK